MARFKLSGKPHKTTQFAKQAAVVLYGTLILGGSTSAESLRTGNAGNASYDYVGKSILQSSVLAFT